MTKNKENPIDYKRQCGAFGVEIVGSEANIGCDLALVECRNCRKEARAMFDACEEAGENYKREQVSTKSRIKHIMREDKLLEEEQQPLTQEAQDQSQSQSGPICDVEQGAQSETVKAPTDGNRTKPSIPQVAALIVRSSRNAPMLRRVMKKELMVETGCSPYTANMVLHYALYFGGKFGVVKKNPDKRYQYTQRLRPDKTRTNDK